MMHGQKTIKYTYICIHIYTHIYVYIYIYICIEHHMNLNSKMSMFKYDTRRFWTRYYSFALLHVISVESQDVLSGNYDISVGGFKVLLKFGKNKGVYL
jgi:hypothetical protein